MSVATNSVHKQMVQTQDDINPQDNPKAHQKNSQEASQKTSQNAGSSVTDSTNLIQRMAVIVVGVLVAFILMTWGVHAMQMSDPYIRNVLALTGDAARGHDIFQLNCAVCHGLEAAGEVGPDLHGVSDRKSQVALIQQVISGKTPPMPQFQPNAKDMADLLDYLETL